VNTERERILARIRGALARGPLQAAEREALAERLRTRAPHPLPQWNETDLERFGQAACAAMPGTRVDLERAIAGLPRKAREVLVLRDVQGYKYDEIAQMTGVSLGTVKAQIHRARGLVKEALER